MKGDIEKKAILVVSFGTSYKETREKTINEIVQRVAMAYPEYEVRQAYTSQMVIDKVKAKEGLEIDNVEEAMQKLVDEGYGTLIVQPTHIIAGNESTKMHEAIVPFKDYFVMVTIGEPLLSDPDDFQGVVDVLSGEMMLYSDLGVSIVLMGHGTDHCSNVVYSELENAFRQRGITNYYVGTVEAEPGVEEILGRVKETDTAKVILVPFMIVAGDHATNDMAGEDDDSWKKQFEAAGYEVECVLQGLGEYTGIQELFLTHIQDSMGFLLK